VRAKLLCVTDESVKLWDIKGVMVEECDVQFEE